MAEPQDRKNTRQTGSQGEQIARAYLEQHGFEVLDQNVYTEYGEIGLVAKRGDRLHLVEVKTRRTRAFGHPEEAVTERNIRHMVESAQALLQSCPELGPDYQIDVVAVQLHPDNSYEITYFENAV